MHSLRIPANRGAKSDSLFSYKQRKRILCEAHPGTLSSVNRLTELKVDQGKYAQAEPLLTKVLNGKRRVLGQEHPKTLISMNNLALLYEDQGKYAQAEPCSSRF